MELDGHAPVIFAEDADLATAMKAAGAAKFRNARQVYILPMRLLVHRSLVDNSSQRLVKSARALQLGDGLEDGTTLGPSANSSCLSANEPALRRHRRHARQR